MNGWISIQSAKTDAVICTVSNSSLKWFSSGANFNACACYSILLCVRVCVCVYACACLAVLNEACSKTSLPLGDPETQTCG